MCFVHFILKTRGCKRYLQFRQDSVLMLSHERLLQEPCPLLSPLVLWVNRVIDRKSRENNTYCSENKHFYSVKFPHRCEPTTPRWRVSVSWSASIRSLLNTACCCPTTARRNPTTSRYLLRMLVSILARYFISRFCARLRSSL